MDVDLETPSISQIFRSYPFRLAMYGLVTMAVYQAIFWGVGRYGAAVMGAENGPIETAQVVLALVGALCLFCAAAWAKIGRAGLVMCGAVVGYAAARESDLLFERLLFDDAYKWVVGLPMAVIAMVVVIRERHRLVGETMWLLRQPAATLFVVAGIFLCGVCQTLDRPDMWTSISNATEAATTKAMIEEYAELFAYLMLALSGIEAVILARSGNRSGQSSYPIDRAASEHSLERLAA